ncbi:hypothetical protein [Caulobacter endophyticus]|uniref:hypothetical protein n=1 Tax=Caulobacter endophyticus TaxID=2172652 RepID=UPI00240F46EE|nr:hypothetical protein [Caulobacter endophyticus]MDG2530679.1 hypothetical protein [Caulobacter endophyticus]
MILKPHLAAVAAAMAIAVPALAAPTTAAPDLARDADALIARMLDLSKTDGGGQDEQCPAALADQVDALVARRGFDALDAFRRDAVLYAVVVCRPFDDARAVSAARRLDRDDVPPPILASASMVLLADAASRNDGKGELAALERAVAADAAQVAALPPEMYGQTVEDLKDDPAGRARALDLLRGLDWPTEDGHDQVDNDWALVRAQLAADDGDMTRAGAVLDRAGAPHTLLAVAQDRRFAPLWAQMEAAGRFDWTKVLETALAKAEDQSRREPANLKRVAYRVDHLRSLGRRDEAIAAGAAALARLKAGEAFEDVELSAPMLVAIQASVLSEVGRFDEADALLAQPVAKDQLTQNTARAALLLGLDRSAEVLKVVDAADASIASPFGLMWLDELRACAHHRLGDEAAAGKSLEKLRKGWRDNPYALSGALLCLGRDDEAAQLMIRRLRDPALRGDALKAFRDGPSPPAIPSRDAELDARRRALVARPEVVSVMREYGRAITVPLSGDYAGGY